MNVDVIRLLDWNVPMRMFVFLAMALAGLTAGLIAGLAFNGLSNTKTTLSLGFGGALIFVLLQIANYFGESSQQRILSRRRKSTNDKLRVESEGSFRERMDRYTASVEKPRTTTNEKPTMPIWTADNLDYREPTPPKPIGIIRALLFRIRNLVASSK